MTDQAKARSDGYIWGMIRNGRGLMPPYNRIEEMDRWDVVNYLRGLQGKYPVDGRPGRPSGRNRRQASRRDAPRSDGAGEVFPSGDRGASTARRRMTMKRRRRRSRRSSHE